MWITNYPAGGARQGQEGLHASRCSPAWRRASSCSTRSARTSAAGCRRAPPRSGSSARATARSTTRSGEKKGGPAPRGMDRFATEVRRRRAHREHRHRHPGPAHRHQHHRPRGRGPPLRSGGGRATDAGPRQPGGPRRRAASDGRLASSPSLDRRRRSSSPSFVQHAQGQGRGRLRDRARAPTASPTSATRSSRARGSNAALGFALRPAGRHRHRAAARTGSPSRAASRRRGRGLQGRASSSGAGVSTTDQGAKCAGCHGPERRRRRRRTTPSLNARRHFVAQVNWKAPALNTVLYRFSSRRGQVHPQLRPPGHPDAGVGRSTAVARSTTSSSTTSSTTCSASSSRSSDSQDAVQKEIDTVCKPDAAQQRHAERHHRRGQVRRPLGEALFNLGDYDGFAGGAYSLRPLPHQGLVLRHARGARRRRRRWAPNLTGGSEVRQFRDGEQQRAVRQHRLRARQALRHQAATAPGQMPGFGVNPERRSTRKTAEADRHEPGPDACTRQDQIPAIVAYERSL